MIITDTGVLEPSFIDFTLPSAFARSALRYVIQYGRFFCDERYRIKRDFLNQFLMVCVESGSLLVETRNVKATAGPGDDPLEAIGAACGFNSASHFARAFRKECEMSPSAFRKLEL